MTAEPPVKSSRTDPIPAAATDAETSQQVPGAEAPVEAAADDAEMERRMTLEVERLSREQARNGQTVRGSDDDTGNG